MKKDLLNIFPAFLLLNIVFCGTAFSKNDDLLGKWKGEDGHTIILICRSDSLYYGKIAQLKDIKALDVKEGAMILKGFAYDNEKHVWTNGQVYAPKRHAFYDGTIKMVDRNTISITAHAGLFYKSTTWKRVE